MCIVYVRAHIPIESEVNPSSNEQNIVTVAVCVWKMYLYLRRLKIFFLKQYSILCFLIAWTMYRGLSNVQKHTHTKSQQVTFLTIVLCLIAVRAHWFRQHNSFYTPNAHTHAHTSTYTHVIVTPYTFFFQLTHIILNQNLAQPMIS